MTMPVVAPQARLNDLLDAPPQPQLRHGDSEMRPVARGITSKQQDVDRQPPNASGCTTKENKRLRTFFGPGFDARIPELTNKAPQGILTEISIRGRAKSSDHLRPQSEAQPPTGYWTAEMPSTQN